MPRNFFMPHDHSGSKEHFCSITEASKRRSVFTPSMAGVYVGKGVSLFTLCILSLPEYKQVLEHDFPQMTMDMELRRIAS